MMAYFLMSSRKEVKGELGIELDSKMSYFVAPDLALSKVITISNWTRVTEAEFRKQLTEAAQKFPLLSDEENEKQKHVSLFVHGYNNSWQSAITRYVSIKKELFKGANSLGELICYTWPSDGSAASYLPDREDARDSAPLLADALVRLNDHVVALQRLASSDIEKQCRAKVSIIAHSMGNFVVQKALAIAAKKLNSPQLITLIHQLVMVAADVDNDIFDRSIPSGSDGWLMSNVCFRIAALYTGLDQVLGASAGLKHFGTRRLGRSGLANQGANVHDNVFDFDVSDRIIKKNIHSAVFDSPDAIELLRKILIGIDRKHLDD